MLDMIFNQSFKKTKWYSNILDINAAYVYDRSIKHFTQFIICQSKEIWMFPAIVFRKNIFNLLEHV